MSITKYDAVRRLASVSGRDRARVFCELVPQIESDEDLFDLVGLLTLDLPEETTALAWLLIRLITGARKEAMDWAEQYRQGFRSASLLSIYPWLERGATVPTIVDAIGGDSTSFRRALIALARSAFN